MIQKSTDESDTVVPSSEKSLPNDEVGEIAGQVVEFDDRILLIQSRSPRRVKVYLLQGDDWLDNGTGYCMGKVDSDTHKPYFIVHNELDAKDIILQSYLEGCIQYQRQQETLIVWSDSSGKDLALSFQENEGCADLCDFIVKVQQENLSPMISLYYVITSLVQDGNSSNEGAREITELIAGPITYPPSQPTCEELAEVLDIFAQGSNSLYSRFKILGFVIENNYLALLYELFEACEKSRDLTNLHLLNDIIKMLLVYNEAILFSYFFSNELSIHALAALLEYDREFPDFKADHRTALETKFKYSTLSKLDNPPVFSGTDLSVIRMEHVLVYFRSVFVSTMFDDHVIATLSTMIYKCQLEILNHLRCSQLNGNFLESLFMGYNPSTLDLVERRDGIRMIHYFAMVAKCHVATVKPEFFGNLIRSGFSKMITAALNDTDPDIRALGTELVVTILDQDVSFVNTTSSNENHVDELEDVDDHMGESAHSDDGTPQPLRLKLIYDVELSVSLSKLLLHSLRPGLQIQAFEALKSILYAAATEITAAGDSRNSDEDSPKKLDYNGSSEVSEKYYQQFYEFVAPVLFENFVNLPSSDDLSGNGVEASLIANPEVNQYVCDLISFCCREHDNRTCREFMLKSGLVKGLFNVLTLKTNILLKLATIRCLKSVLIMCNLDISLYIIRHDLFAHFFGFFRSVVSHNSCSNSLCLDLLSVIVNNSGTESGLVLAAYIYKLYREFLETKLDCFSVGRSFLQSFEAADKLFQMNGPVEAESDSDKTPQAANVQFSSPISDEVIDTKVVSALQHASGGVKVAKLFQDIEMQNESNKRQRDESGDNSVSNGNYYPVSESNKRKTPVLWADNPSLEEEAYS